MTSVLNVDTIADKAGTGPVALTKQSAAKAWTKYDQATTTAIDVSFGVSGITDHGSGDATTAFTNSFSSADFAHSGFAKENGLINWKSSAAGNIRCVTITTSAVNADYDEVAIILFGDLV